MKIRRRVAVVVLAVSVGTMWGCPLDSEDVNCEHRAMLNDIYGCGEVDEDDVGDIDDQDIEDWEEENGLSSFDKIPQIK